MRVLLDELTPRHFGRLLSGHEVRTAPQMGWASVGNGELLRRAAAAGFDVLVTVDRNLEYLQNVARTGIAVVVLVARSNSIPDLHRSRHLSWKFSKPCNQERSFTSGPDATADTPGEGAPARAMASAARHRACDGRSRRWRPSGSPTNHKRGPTMPYDRRSDLPQSVRDNLLAHAQGIYKEAFNSAWEQYGHDESRAHRVAWGAVEKKYHKDASGKWVEGPTKEDR